MTPPAATLVAALGRIDDIQQRIRSLSVETTTASTAETAGAGSSTASAFASAVREANGVAEVPTLPAGPVDGGDIVAQAKEYLGVPYVFGGEDRSGMDCSGLVQRVLADLGIDAPRVVQDQADIGVEVPSLADAQPGDLIVTKGEGHIVIYAGDGMVIHAPSPGKFVEHRNNWLKDADIATIRRVVPPPGGAAVAAMTESVSVAGLSSTLPASGAAPAATATALSASLASAVGLSGGSASATSATAFGDAFAQPGVASASAASAAATVNATALRELAATALSELAPASPSDGSAPLAAFAPPTAVPTAPAVTAAAPAAPAAPAAAAAPAPLAQQVTAPVVSLVRSGDGEHTLTLRVSPEDLGPVTVKAHISGGSITVELASGTAAGRDALRALLTDLRRDLAVLVPHSSIAVTAADGRADAGSMGTGTGAAGGQTMAGQTGSGQTGSGQSGSDRAAPRDSAPAAETVPAPAPPASVAVPVSGIDLYA